MKRINVMSKHMADLIAAGEVVERPASIVKELCENSIDAGADKLTVEIKNGGKSYIRVSDNGHGISKEDLPLAFVSHATSKIKTEEDLSSIGTLGFRGEALASICAVSRISVLTCASDENSGTNFVIEGGNVISADEAGCPVGTTIIVRDVFYNTPARMKFLKKDVSEANYVASVVDKIALSHPEVAVTFIREGKQVLTTSGDGELKNAIYSVFGKDFYSSLIEVDYTLENVRVWGYISRPTECKPNRSMQYFFVSGRQVKSVTAMVALDEAYKNSAMVGKVPACVLHIEVAPNFVDVNVHPSKIEVRFQNDKSVYNAVFYGAKNALEQGDKPKQIAIAPSKPVLDDRNFLKKEKSEQITFPIKGEPVKREREDFWQHIVSPNRGAVSATVAKSPSFSYEKEDQQLKNDILNSVKKNESNMSNDSTADSVTVPDELKTDKSTCEPERSDVNPEDIRVVGEIFKTYIIAETKSEVFFIDKHAAHERMLFERLKKEKHDGTQMLLEPVIVTLSKEDYRAVIERSELLSKAGFVIEDFGPGTVRVSGYPILMDSMDIKSAVEEIAGYIRENRNDLTPEFLDWVYHNVACRAAIKAGNNLKAEELEAFTKKLFCMPDIRYCPHGRPVMVSMSKYTFEKQFGRIQ